MAVAVYKVDISGRVEGEAVNSWTMVQGSIPSDPFPPSSVDAAQTALNDFYTAITSRFNSSLDWTFPTTVDVFDEATGQLQSVVSGTGAPTTESGSASASTLSTATQMKLQTRSGVVQDGRELRGGVFLGPIAGAATDNDGMINSTTQSLIATAGATLLSDLVAAGIFLVVWRRPRPASAPGGARAGSLALVQSISVWNKPAVLRSRRD